MNSVIVRAGKGDKDRITMMPAAIRESLQKHLMLVKEILRCDGNDDLWLVRARPPPKIHAPPATAYSTDDLSPYSPPDAQFYGDPGYSWDDYIQA